MNHQGCRRTEDADLITPRGNFSPAAVNGNTSPRISVITVVRNGVSIIAGCIESVLAQQIEGMEYIIIDGASIDGTLDIIRRYGDAISVCASEPDQGLYDAMNKGLAHAHGEFVHFLNADDRYVAPDTLRTLLPQLDAGTVCHAQMVYVEASGRRRLLGEPFIRRRELKASRMPQPVMFVPRQMYAAVGSFDTGYRIAADYDMVLRLTQRFPTHFIKQPVTVMHAGGLSYRQPELAFRESMHVARRHGRGWLASWWDFFLKHTKWRAARWLPRLRG
jgi:glycosyltransferase involved in cell wall biosynthesis